MKGFELISGLGAGISSCACFFFGAFCSFLGHGGRIDMDIYGGRIDMQQLAIFQVQCNALYASEMAEYAFHSFQYSTYNMFQVSILWHL